MSFINELIPDDAKRNIDWSKFKWRPYSQPHRPWKWTIDRSIDAFLVPVEKTGREDGPSPQVFILSWKGHLVRIEAFLHGSGAGQIWDTLFWEVHKVSVPVEIQNESNAILSSMRSALCVYGSLFSTENIKAVHVDVPISGVSP